MHTLGPAVINPIDQSYVIHRPSRCPFRMRRPEPRCIHNSKKTAHDAVESVHEEKKTKNCGIARNRTWVLSDRCEKPQREVLTTILQSLFMCWRQEQVLLYVTSNQLLHFGWSFPHGARSNFVHGIRFPIQNRPRRSSELSGHGRE